MNTTFGPTSPVRGCKSRYESRKSPLAIFEPAHFERMQPLEQASAWVCESGGRPPCRVRSPVVLHLRARRSTSRTGPARPPPARCANPQRPRCTRRSLFCCCGMREARCYSVHARKVCPIHHSNRLTRLFFRTQVSCQRYYSDSAFGASVPRTQLCPQT